MRRPVDDGAADGVGPPQQRRRAADIPRRKQAADRRGGDVHARNAHLGHDVQHKAERLGEAVQQVHVPRAARAEGVVLPHDDVPRAVLLHEQARKVPGGQGCKSRVKGSSAISSRPLRAASSAFSAGRVSSGGAPRADHRERVLQKGEGARASCPRTAQWSAPPPEPSGAPGARRRTCPARRPRPFRPPCAYSISSRMFRPLLSSIGGSLRAGACSGSGCAPPCAWPMPANACPR